MRTKGEREQRNGMKWIAPILLVLLLFFPGCSDSEDSDLLPDGDNEISDVEQDSDDFIDGDFTDGDVIDGDTTDGDMVDGDASDGDLVDGDLVDGDTADGDLITDGDQSDGDVIDGDLEADLEPDDNPFGFPEEFLNQVVPWQYCDLYDDPATGSGTAECADVRVPLFYDDGSRDDSEITIHIKRLKAGLFPARQIWLLQGGPGAAGTTDFPFFMEQLIEADPGIEVYAVDHRGTGYSARMGCPEQEAEDSEWGYFISEAEWPACIEYLKNDWLPTDAFTVTNAATDVALLAEIMKKPGVDRFIYGVSYGSYWVHRYAQLYPDQVQGVIMDSVAPTDETYLDHYDILGNTTIQQFFGMCAEDTLCHEKMGDDPYQKALDALDNFRNNDHCSELQTNYGITPEYIQMLGFSLGMSWYGRVLVPALFYRLDRCNDDDVVAIYNAVFQVLGSSDTVSAHDRQNSSALGRHIGTSELTSQDGTTVAEMTTIYESLLVQLGVGRRMLQFPDTWPHYTPDSYFKQWASQDVPLLMMNGTLDLQTPIEIADNAEQNLTGEHQYFVTIPNGNHGVVSSSPVQSDGGYDCGFQILVDYLKHPLQQPDTTCLSDLKPIDFTGEIAYSQYYFGETDIWEKAQVPLDCSLPEDYFNARTDSHFIFSYRGFLSSWSPGWTETDVMLDGQVYQADSYAANASRTTTQSGLPVVHLEHYGQINQISPGYLQYLYSSLDIPLNQLTSLKQSGEHQLDFAANLTAYLQTVVQLQEKRIDDDTNYKYCPVAVSDVNADNSSLYVCHEGNLSFANGELIQFAGNTTLTTDTDAIESVFQLGAPCTCWKNNNQALSCDAFDAIDMGSTKSSERDQIYFVKPVLPVPEWAGFPNEKTKLSRQIPPL